MGVYIKDMEMPKGFEMLVVFSDGTVHKCLPGMREHVEKGTAVPIPTHGRLIDADALRAKMYHEAFETDSPMQKWDSGCWIRYKMFERMEEAASTIIPAEEGE